MTTVHTLLAVVAAHQWPLHQMNVNNVFLHGSLFEVIYMELPLGFLLCRDIFVAYVVLYMVSNKLPELGLSVSEVLFVR